MLTKEEVEAIHTQADKWDGGMYWGDDEGRR